MIRWAASLVSGDPLVFAIGAAFFITITALTISTLRGNGWGWRRTAATAIAWLRGRIAAAGARRRRWQATAAQKAATLIAFRGETAAVQRNMRIKIAAVLAGAGSKPSRAKAVRDAVPLFDLGRDLRFAGSLEELVGVYLSPPEHALAWICDERQLQAVDRTAAYAEASAPGLRRELLGSTPLSEALIDLAASVIGSCDRLDRHREWLSFLREVERHGGHGRQLRVLCDNQATQEHAAVRRWMTAHPHVHVQFTASSGSGLKMIKRFFDDVIAEQLGVRAFQSVADLTAAIGRHVAARVADAAPFVWIRQSHGIPAAGGGRTLVSHISEKSR